jgi:hypothetical protein
MTSPMQDISHPTSTMIRADTECNEQPQCTIQDPHILLPYVANCSQYIYCNDYGNAEIRDCPTGQHFSPTEKKCMDPNAAQCPDCSHTTTEGTTEDTTVTTSPIITSTLPYCDNQPHCTPATINQNIPYIYNCSLYIYCDENGNEIIRSCPNSEHFSPTEQRCTDPATAQCEECPLTTIRTTERVTTLQPTSERFTTPPPTTGTTERITYPQTTTERYTTIDYCAYNAECIDWPYSNIPYIYDCTKFTYCNNDGTGLLSNCPLGSLFHRYEWYCTDPSLAECTDCPLP